MINAIRQQTLVKGGGKIEISAPELPSGTLVEVIVFLVPDPDELDTTDYLLSTEANRQHLYQALADLEKPSTYIYVNPENL
jgi:antitoxin YefM